MEPTPRLAQQSIHIGVALSLTPGLGGQVTDCDDACSAAPGLGSLIVGGYRKQIMPFLNVGATAGYLFLWQSRSRIGQSIPLNGSSQLVDVNDVIREMVMLLRGDAVRFAVSIRTELMEGTLQVSADRAQLKQALMNLMINGMEAMTEAKGIRKLVIKSGVNAKEITVSVSDTGVGLPPTLSEHIFRSFVTTKPHSIGIGLSISRSIIEDHGGRLWAANNLPRGAHFHLTLPIEMKIAH